MEYLEQNPTRLSRFESAVDQVRVTGMEFSIRVLGYLYKLHILGFKQERRNI